MTFQRQKKTKLLPTQLTICRTPEIQVQRGVANEKKRNSSLPSLPFVVRLKSRSRKESLKKRKERNVSDVPKIPNKRKSTLTFQNPSRPKSSKPNSEVQAQEESVPKEKKEK